MSTSALLLAAALASATTPLHVKQPPLRAGAEVQRAAPDEQVTLEFGLRLADRAGLDAAIAAQHDPASPSFRRYLTPEEFGQRFGRSAAEYQALTTALERGGLTVKRWPSRLFVTATGSAQQVEKLLGVTLLDGRLGGERFVTFRGTPALSAELAPLVQSVFGLDTQLRPRPRQTMNVCSLSGTFGTQDAFGPDDLRTYYDLGPLLSGGGGGAGTEVAMLGVLTTGQAATDTTQVQGFYVQAASGATVVVEEQNAAGAQRETDAIYRIEEQMDAELPTVAAPGASTVHMVLGPLVSMFTSDMSHVVNDLPQLASVTISFGFCEQQFNVYFANDNAQTLADLVAQGAAEGQSWFASSGDYGVDDCGDASGPTVDLPASLPYVVAMGGTMYTGAFDGSHAIPAYGAETTWNEPGLGAGGGGQSGLFAKPAWQTGLGTVGTQRELPDISVLAASMPGVGIVVSPGNALEACGDGTSDAAPLTAGIFALLDSRLGCRVGPPALELYRFAAAQQAGTGPAVFHDMVTGNISFDGLTGASATPGYDEATGLGSLDVEQLYQAYLQAGGCGAFDGGFTLPDAGPPFDAGFAIGCDPLVTPPTCAGGGACVPSAPAFPFDGGTCQPGCTTNADCPGQACSACTHRCVDALTPVDEVGRPCGTTNDCATGAICVEDVSGFPGGYCTYGCDPGVPACQCPTGSLCPPGNNSSICVATCDVPSNSGCRVGYACWDMGQGVVGGCAPRCGFNTDCVVAGDVCNAAGACVPPSTSSTTTGTSSGPSTTTATATSTTGPATTGTSGVTTAGSTSGSGSTTGHTSGGATTGGHTTGHALGSTGSTTGSETPTGCGCGTGKSGGLELGMLGAALAWLAARRRMR